jgi:2-keto-4-pentenoate hydratase/2-oxohepta-3-ene-1,7-dioic acid hydratase in catechol pathway
VAYKAQQQCLDFEGEMVFQTGSKPLKNITPEEAKKYIIGFTTGHDFTPRPGTVLGRMSFIWAKAFDDWTPMYRPRPYSAGPLRKKAQEQSFVRSGSK